MNLETFTILFKSDSSDVIKGAQDAEKAVGKVSDKLKRVDHDSSIVGQHFHSLASSFLSAFTISTASYSVLSHFRQSIDFGEQLSYNARALGVSVTQLQAWSNAVELAGGSSEQFQGSLKSLSMRFNSDSSVALKVLPRLAGLLSRLNQTQAMNYGKSLGLDEATILLLRRGRYEVENIIKKQKELRLITEKDAEGYLKLKLATKQNELALRSLYTSLSSDTIPILIKFQEKLSLGFDYLTSHKDLIKGAFIAIGAGVAIMAAAFLKANPYIRAVTLGLLAFSLLYEDVKKGWSDKDGNSISSYIFHPEKTLKIAGEGAVSVAQSLSNGYDKLYDKLFGTNKVGMNPFAGDKLVGMTNNKTNSKTVNVNSVTINTQSKDPESIKQILLDFDKQIFQANSTIDDGRLS